MGDYPIYRVYTYATHGALPLYYWSHNGAHIGVIAGLHTPSEGGEQPRPRARVSIYTNHLRLMCVMIVRSSAPYSAWWGYEAHETTCETTCETTYHTSHPP